jgi:hypothetical protein
MPLEFDDEAAVGADDFLKNDPYGTVPAGPAIEDESGNADVVWSLLRAELDSDLEVGLRCD